MKTWFQIVTHFYIYFPSIQPLNHDIKFITFFITFLPKTLLDLSFASFLHKILQKLPHC